MSWLQIFKDAVNGKRRLIETLLIYSCVFCSEQNSVIRF